MYQYLGDRVLLGAGYRLHHQTAVRSWTRALAPERADRDTPRTSDSDLATLWSAQWLASLRLYLRPPSNRRGPQSLSFEYLRYRRSHGLRLDMALAGYAFGF